MSSELEQKIANIFEGSDIKKEQFLSFWDRLSAQEQGELAMFAVEVSKETQATMEAQLQAAKAEALTEPNQLLRSVYQVVKRQGKDTNWEGLRKQLEAELKQEHEIMHLISEYTDAVVAEVIGETDDILRRPTFEKAQEEIKVRDELRAEQRQRYQQLKAPLTTPKEDKETV